MEYPVRINKYLALENICSRKEADVLIKQGKVRINNRPAVLGDKVGKTDKVSVVNFQKEYIYLTLNKPKGILTLGQGESIKDIVKEKVYPVGRLDKDSHGLIILTNDGRITDKMLNPEYNHEKEYIVRVDRSITPSFLKHMEQGVNIEGYVTKKCIVKRLKRDVFSIILTEGKKRQIRRMCGALRYGVQDLERIRIMNIRLDDLKVGQTRNIKGKELEQFLSLLNLV